MYYVPSPLLKDEAKREIKILKQIYEPVIKAFDENYDTELLTSLSYIEFVSQEDLFIITSHTKLDPKYNILREASDSTLSDFLELKKGDLKEKSKRNDVKKALRNISFGLLAGRLVPNFHKLIPEGKGIDLFQPLNNDNIGNQAIGHKLGLAHFVGNPDESDLVDKLKRIYRDIDKLRKQNKLYNGADEQLCCCSTIPWTQAS